ncbi:hypothetical protein KFK09_013042 [Dendrobium nobile]|uniref:Uncharacterized protein n=1 Tax=Dendrobium nobile TaxID=94219 RepID=A0A8T3BJ01_DENNO|nr:hypothetical protein KFK09_013042 [Dendrobium nobile]
MYLMHHKSGNHMSWSQKLQPAICKIFPDASFPIYRDANELSRPSDQIELRSLHNVIKINNYISSIQQQQQQQAFVPLRGVGYMNPFSPL